MVLSSLLNKVFFDRVMIKMRNLLNQNAWYWDDAKFVNRSYIIKVKRLLTCDEIYTKNDCFLGTLSKISRW